MQSHYSPANLPSRLAQERAEHVAQIQRLLSCSATHAQKMFQHHAERTLGLWRSGLQTQQGLLQSLQDGKLVAVGAVTWFVTLVSNTEVFPEAPTSWADMWDPKYADSLGLQDNGAMLTREQQLAALTPDVPSAMQRYSPGAF